MIRTQTRLAATKHTHRKRFTRAFATTSSIMAAKKLTLSDQLTMPGITHKIPRLGFGVYQSPASVCEKSVAVALKEGYRHIDSAQYYQNESEVGEAVRKSGIPRDQIFVTTKILSPAGSVQKSYEAAATSVDKFGLDGYVDLFLIHTPSSGPKGREEMWLALERLYEEGKAKAIGVSNYGVKHMEGMKGYAKKVYPPHVNQIELHPWCQSREVDAWCQKNGVVIESYSPIVRNQKADDPTLNALAKKHGKDTAQILIRYGLQKGWVPLPKSDTPSRIKSNVDVYDFELSKEEMQTLDDLDEGARGAICPHKLGCP